LLKRQRRYRNREKAINGSSGFHVAHRGSAKKTAFRGFQFKEPGIFTAEALRTQSKELLIKKSPISANFAFFAVNVFFGCRVAAL
jgi:hypothetical protein